MACRPARFTRSARQLRIWSTSLASHPTTRSGIHPTNATQPGRAVVDAGLSTSNWPAASVLSAISAKNKLQDAASFEQEAMDFNDRMIAKVYSRYESLLRENDALDFDDLLRHVAHLLRDDEVVRASFARRWKYILVDEYQDTNFAQFIIASGLAREHRNICVVGDPDQSIYRWRGADIRNILDFEAHYPDAKVVHLGRNFRSTGHIVKAAAGLVSHNRSHRHKDLHTQMEDGAIVEFRTCSDEHVEADTIVGHFRAAADAGRPWREMAVLYGQQFQPCPEDAFRRSSIPHVVARARLHERREVKDTGYLRLILNPNDEIALGQSSMFPPEESARRLSIDSIRMLVRTASALARRFASHSPFQH